MVPEKIPSIYNGKKTVIYGLLMEKSKQKGKGVKCKATLTGDIIGKKFKFYIPFELTEGELGEADVSVIHQLAVKGMIQEWQDDEGPYKQKHKKEIIELSTDASVVSKYTAYIAVDVAQNKPVSGSMQSYELTAADCFMFNSIGGFPPASRSMSHFGVPPPPGAPPPGNYYFADSLPPPPPPLAANFKSLLGEGPPPSPPSLLNQSIYQSLRFSSIRRSPKPPMFTSAQAPSAAKQTGASFIVSLQQVNGSWLLKPPPSPPSRSLAMHSVSIRGHTKPPMFTSAQAPSAAKQAGASFLVSLQQANGSWLLNDQLAGVVSKSVEELKSCCPVSCDDAMMANIWATLVVIELLKKKYPSMLDELELVIMKAEQWLSKQVLPSSINLTTLKEHTGKLLCDT